jgi:predicted nicotinamide N-methyase
MSYNIVEPVRTMNLSMVEASDLSSTTGRKTWNAALVTKEYLKRCGVEGKRVCDVSSGNGFLAMALSLLGAAEVYATECPACVRLLQANFDSNFDSNKQGDRVKPIAIEYSWGDDMSKVTSSITSTSRTCSDDDKAIEEEPLDLYVFSDLLYICFRDDILSLFETTLKDLLSSDKTVGVFCYETRLTVKEQAFIDDFLKVTFDTTELDCDQEGLLEVCKESEDGTVEEGDFGSIFYTPPTMRLLLLRRKKGSAPVPYM